MELRKLTIDEREKKLFGIWVPITFCDITGCNKPAEYKIVGQNPPINLCQGHFSIVQQKNQVTLREEKPLPAQEIPAKEVIPQGGGLTKGADFGKKRAKKYKNVSDDPIKFKVVQELYSAWGWPEKKDLINFKGQKYVLVMDDVHQLFLFTEMGTPCYKVDENLQILENYSWIRENILEFASKHWPEYFSRTI